MKGSTIIKTILGLTTACIGLKYLVMYGIWAFEKGGEEIVIFMGILFLLDVAKMGATIICGKGEGPPWHFWISFIAPFMYFISKLPNLWGRLMKLADKHLTS